MADKTLTITAPEELIDQVIVAYAAQGELSEGQTEEELAVEQMIDGFRETILSYDEQVSNAVIGESRMAQREAEKQKREVLMSRRDEVIVTIE